MYLYNKSHHKIYPLAKQSSNERSLNFITAMGVWCAAEGKNVKNYYFRKPFLSKVKYLFFFNK